MLVALCVLLAAAAASVMALGIALALMDRGKTTVRKGPDIYGEMFAERMEREARLAGRLPTAQVAAGVGKGVAWERAAVYTLPELKQAVAEGRYRAAAPALLGMGGLLATLLFAGAAVALRFAGNGRIVGLMLIGFSLYGTYMVGKDWVATKP